jgi:acyl carrier protein
MKEEDVRSKILSFFREKEIMKGLGEDQDIFALGVSSLTVVELQIVVEKALGLQVQTSDLMRSPTVNGWVELYMAKANSAAEA